MKPQFHMHFCSQSIIPRLIIYAVFMCTEQTIYISCFYEFVSVYLTLSLYFQLRGPISFEFNMDEIRTRLRNEFGMYSGFEGVELHFNASVYDWFFRMTRVGYASTVLYKSGVKLQWVGDKVRTFKPDSVLTVQVKKDMNYFCCTLLQIHLLNIEVKRWSQWFSIV